MKIEIELDENELAMIQIMVDSKVSSLIDNKNCLYKDQITKAIKQYNDLADKFHDARLEAVNKKQPFTMHKSGQYPAPEHQVSYPDFHNVHD